MDVKLSAFGLGSFVTRICALLASRTGLAMTGKRYQARLCPQLLSDPGFGSMRA